MPSKSKAPNHIRRRRAKRVHEVNGALGLLDGGVCITTVTEKQNGRAAEVVLGQQRPDGICLHDPRYAVGQAITDSLDPIKARAPVRTLADMSEEERAALTAQYGVPVTMPKLRRVHLQRPPVSSEVLGPAPRCFWWLCRAYPASRRPKFIALLHEGQAIRGDTALDVTLNLLEGTYRLGCGTMQGHREQLCVDDRFPLAETPQAETAP